MATGMEHFGDKRGRNAYLSADGVIFFMVKRSQACSSGFFTRDEALARIAQYLETGNVN